MKQGFIALITILLVSAIAVIISSSILLKSITESRLSTDEESATVAWATVNACAEYALIHLASTTVSGYPSTTNGWNNFATSSGLSVSNGANSCYIYSILNNAGGTSSPRQINASSTVNNFTRKLSIIVATDTPAISVTAWTDVADF